MTTLPPSRRFLLTAMLGALLCAPLHAQPAAAQALLEKAHALDQRGRIDLASLTWQQVLLVDPANAEALAGLARAAKLQGHADEATTFLERLRAVNPNDPNLARIQTMDSAQPPPRTELDQAAAFAADGQYRQAMTLYRRLYGATPPPGDIALAYYDTEAATEDGRPHAIAGLRTLAARNPTDARYQIVLARILTYTPKTRAEGRHLLERFPNDPTAVEALRQSLLWDARNPASTTDLRAYLALHPDPQLAQALKTEKPLPPQALEPRAPPEPRPAPEPPRLTDQQTADRDLHAGRIGEAEQLFQTILDRHPADGPALAGMGYIRMQQGNFGGAISFLTQAQQHGVNDRAVETALETSRFWYIIAAGQSALAANDLPTAEKQFQTAVALRPTSPEALDGLGTTLLRSRQPEAAAQLYDRFTRAQPTSPAAWRGLLQAQFAAGQPALALATQRNIPAAVQTQLLHDPRFLQTLASAYAATGQPDEAERTLQAALALPFPTGTLQAETQLQYASLLLQAGRLDQAESLYRQVLATRPVDTAAWIGLLRVQHASGQDEQAMQTLESLPPAVYAAATRDPVFDATVAALFQGQGKLDTAQDILEKSLAQQAAAAEPPSIPLQIQLAGIYLQRNRPQLAFPLYQRILAAHPGRLEAWMGLLAALHTSARDQEALAQIRQLPTPTRLQLELDPAYLQTVASIYQSLNQPSTAAVFLARIEQIYTLRDLPPPTGIELENASLLLSSGNDPALYEQLLALGSRTDLNDDQRRTLQGQWAAWALRRANQASAANDPARALAILNTAAAAFPNDRAVLNTLAAGYAPAGRPRQALALFQPQDMATATDYLSAITASLAASDDRATRTWLNKARAAYPQDPQILLLAARFEQTHGSAHRAANLYRASLAAMPPPPDDPTQTHADNIRPSNPASPYPALPQDLATLLAPSGATSPALQPFAPVQPPSHTPQFSPSPSDPTRLPSQTPNLTPNDTPNLTPRETPISTNRPPPTALSAPLRLRNASLSPTRDPAQFALPIPPTSRNPAVIIYGPYVPYHPTPNPETLRGESRPPEDGPAAPSPRVSPQIPRTAQPTGSQGQQHPQPPRKPTSPRRASRPAAAQTPAQPASPPPSAASQPIPASERDTVVGTLIPDPYSLIPVSHLLPPLTYPAPYTRATLTPPLPSPPAASRQQAQQELASLEATYTASIAATGIARTRTGAPGLDRLTDIESPTEFSAVLARNVRAAIIPRPVFLNSGTLNPAAAHSYPLLGTQPTTTSAPQQIANGLGGEAQLVTANYGLAAGYTPYEFLVPNLTARLRLRPAAGPITLLAERQPIRETQLSYAGLRDPANPTHVWGGVVSTGATFRLDLTRFSFQAQGATLTGRHVQPNTAFTTSAATRFRLHTWPRAGTLNLAAAAYASHFAHNERGLSYGQGGYFSPNLFVLAAAPLTFTGHTRTRLHYRLAAAPGFQTYIEHAAPFYPLDPTLQSVAVAACPLTQTCATYPLHAATSAHYAVDASAAYAIADHWSFAAFLSANNTNLYNEVTAGFSLRYLFTPQIPLDETPTGLFPNDGLLPLRLP